MPTLISSATSGKKAAPKAPPRRRPAGPPPPAAKPTPKPVETTLEDAAGSNIEPSLDAIPPTPPQTQQSPARPSVDSQHVRFAEPVTISQQSSQPTGVSAPQQNGAVATIEDRATDLSVSVQQSEAQQKEATVGADAVPQGESHTSPPPTNPARPEATTPQQTSRSAKRARTSEPSTAESQARKAPKRSSARSNAKVQAQVEDTNVPEPSQTPRRPAVARMTATSQKATDASSGQDAGRVEDHENVESQSVKKAPAKRKTRKVKTPARVDEDEGLNGESGQDSAAKPKKSRKPRQKRAPAKSKAQNSPTEGSPDAAEAMADGEVAEDEQPDESDPELHEIDPEALSMYNITKHKRYGKTSEREKKMAEIDWDEVKRKRRLEAEGVVSEEPQASSQQKQLGNAESTEDADGNTAASKQEAAETRAVQGGLGFRVVNGEIVEDEDTLQIDRRAQAQAEIALQAPVEEENDLTRFHNRTTYLNDRKRDEKDRVPVWKSKSDPWNEEETDRFYEALKNWGTDFQIISQLFPPKTRMQIKKKFNREERLDPERVNAALLGKDVVRMDLNAYAQAANLDISEFNKFDSLEHAQTIISESMRDKEEAMRVAVKEAEETERQRAVQEAQKKKGREAAESRKKLTQAKKAMRAKGLVWGAGTFGGFGGGDDDTGGES